MKRRDLIGQCLFGRKPFRTFNVWGTLDPLYAFYQGLVGARIDPSALGADRFRTPAALYARSPFHSVGQVEASMRPEANRVVSPSPSFAQTARPGALPRRPLAAA